MVASAPRSSPKWRTGLAVPREKPARDRVRVGRGRGGGKFFIYFTRFFVRNRPLLVADSA